MKLDFDEQLFALSEAQDEKAKEFREACLAYAESYFSYQKLLCMRVITETNKKLALEKIIVAELADETFSKVYYDYLISKAKKEGFSAELEAIKTKVMTRMSIMKFSGKLDSFGNVL